MSKLLMTLAIISLFVTACKDDDPATEPYKPKVDISGFTFTDFKGKILSADTNDWRETALIKKPLLYPNPVEESDTANFEFTLEQLAICSVRIVDPNDSSRVIHQGALAAGWHIWKITGLKAGSYRLYFSANQDTSYGDILVSKIGVVNRIL